MKEFIRQYRFLILIALGGLVLRVLHLGWGLPAVYEEATPLTMASKFWNAGNPGFDFNPHFFNYPALTFYVQFAAQVVHYLFWSIGGGTGLQHFLADVPSQVVAARLVTALFDTGIIIAVYLLAERAANRTAGLLAAGFAALNPLLIRQAHLVQVDTPLAFFATLSLYFIVRCYKDRSLNWYILAGIFIGLAAASKYTGALLLPVLLGAHLLRATSTAHARALVTQRTIVSAFAVAGGVFLLTNPFILLDYGEFSKDFSFEEYHIAAGHFGIDPGQSTFDFYFLRTIPDAFGILFALVLLITAVNAFIRRDRFSIILLMFPLIMLLVLSTWEMRAERYLLPAVPAMIVLGVIGLTDLIRRVLPILRRGSGTSAFASGISIAGLLIVSIQPAWSSFIYLKDTGLPDTRAEARAWTMGHLKPGSVIATGPYGIEFPDSLYSILHIPFLAVDVDRVLPFYDSRWYEDADLLIACDFDYLRFARSPDRYRGFLAYYDSLHSEWGLVHSVLPGDSMTGPAIWLYRFPDSSRRRLFDPSLFDRFSAQPESSRISGFLKELASVLRKKGRLEKCAQVLQEILGVEVENVPAHNELANIYVELDRHEDALKQMQLSLKLNSQQPDVFALAGRSLLRIDHPREAEMALQKALDFNPKMTEPYEDLIALYTKQNDRARLLTTLRRYLAILPQSGERAAALKKEIAALTAGK